MKTMANLPIDLVCCVSSACRLMMLLVVKLVLLNVSLMEAQGKRRLQSLPRRI
jgi:hypothetical protein